LTPNLPVRVPTTRTGPLRELTTRVRRPREVLALALLVCVVSLGVLSILWVTRHTLAILDLRHGVGDIVFYGADRRPWFRLDEHRRDVPIGHISPFLQRAVLAVEDHRFELHPGIDPLAVGRAVYRNLRGGGFREGGSTITQQLARTLFLSNARTPARKAKEAVLALMLDTLLTKQQILELYLNRIYLGSGMYGVETMSWSVFRKHARDLTVGEAALIAGLIRAPGTLSPWSNPDKALHRSHVVLRRMREEGFITPAQEQAARRERPRFRQRPASADARGGYAKEYLRQQFRDRFGADNPPNWQVHTTFLPALQDAAERSVADGLRRLDSRDLQVALVALDPQTGGIRAMVGGSDYAKSPFNRAYRSFRQPGSAFKPFVYAAALERGYSPVSVLPGPRLVQTSQLEEWSPHDDDSMNQDLALREAFFESNNRAAVALLGEIGTRPVRQLASELGMGQQPNVPSLALGSGTVTPLALASAYAVFPNGGYAVRPRAILRVLDEDREVALASETERERVLSPQTAFQMVTMMQDVVRRGTGRGVRSLGVSFPVAGKTGSTNNFKDAWFVGFSPTLVAAVWVGFDQPATIGRQASGARVALPIWSDFMRRTGRIVEPGDFAVPAGLHARELCQVSYLRPVDGCPTYLEYLKDGDKAPGRLCTLHRGSLKQYARRAVEGFLAALGRGLRGIFR
jgi:1A family penicillin-binding protein